MQNEISPRRATERKVPRRGVQQAGRIGRANGDRGWSICCLLKMRSSDERSDDGACRQVSARYVFDPN